MTEKYRRFLHAVRAFMPRERVYTDYLRRLAWGTDAGFYRLVPQIVVRAAGEDEVVRLMQEAARLRVSLTFRAAGTSLSGQAVSDSVLVVAGKHWERCEVLDGGRAVRLQPGVVGARINEVLKPFGYRFPPDPASIRSAMAGGIVMNNASGMNCGTHANSDRMLLSARLVLADGTLLDTGDEASRRDFSRSHGEFLRAVEALRDRVRGDEALTRRILHKYSIKNVMGLNLLPLVRFDDPFEIIAHLMVGSEGTLAFLAGVTMRTEREYEHKASAMVYFSDIGEASRAVVEMRKLQDAAGERIVYSAEMLDSKSLASVGDATGEGLTAVLTETKAHTPEELAANVARIGELLGRFVLYVPARFTDDPAEQAKYWAVRSGIFPAVGGSRPAGTTCLIEDVAFHIEDLPRATAELQALIARHGYDDACIYGHALEGNYHFIINQSFSTPAEAARYEALMNDVAELVVGRYDGSLKAEHGTGRNMAPFLRREWGDDALAVMRAVKELFDPAGLLNPGVIFNDDPRCHLSHFKPLPLTDPLIDRCIECGFCEVNCLTCGLTLSSRQRIVVRREIARLALHQLVTDGRIHPARIEEVVAKVQKQIEEEIVEVGKRTAIDLGIHGLHPELIRLIGKMKYRSSYGQNLLQHARETANLAGIMASELGLNPKIARRAGLLHDIGKVPDDEPELPHAIIGMKLAEKYKEKPDVCNAIGAHHDEVEMTSIVAPIIQVCDAISGARPGARREVVESYIKRLKEMEEIALSYPGVQKTYAIQAGRELRVIVGADKLSDQESEGLSRDIAKKIQDEMTYPGQVKITVIRETRAVAYAK